MNKIEQLLVRACKSLDPDTRLESVVRRFYMTGSKTNQTLIISLLCNFTDEYCPIKSHKLVSDVLSITYYESDATIGDKLYRTMKCHIRFMDTRKLVGLTKARMFR